jgi:hypothetical protein
MFSAALDQLPSIAFSSSSKQQARSHEDMLPGTKELDSSTTI